MYAYYVEEQVTASVGPGFHIDAIAVIWDYLDVHEMDDHRGYNGDRVIRWRVFDAASHYSRGMGDWSSSEDWFFNPHYVDTWFYRYDHGAWFRLGHWLDVHSHRSTFHEWLPNPLLGDHARQLVRGTWGRSPSVPDEYFMHMESQDVRRLLSAPTVLADFCGAAWYPGFLASCSIDERQACQKQWSCFQEPRRPDVMVMRVKNAGVVQQVLDSYREPRFFQPRCAPKR